MIWNALQAHEAVTVVVGRVESMLRVLTSGLSDIVLY